MSAWSPPWARGTTSLSGLHGLYGLSSRDWYKLAGLMALWSADEERGLLELAKQGDRQAIEQLFEHYRPSLMNSLVGKILHDEKGSRYALAEDIAQETLLKVQANIRNFRGDSGFYTWMFRIAKNTAMDHYRKQSRAAAREKREAERPAPVESAAQSWGQSVFAYLLARPDVMHQILSGMTDIQREIFRLREVQGLPYDVIARQLNIPIGTVKYRVFAAREAIEDALATITGRTRPARRTRRKR